VQSFYAKKLQIQGIIISICAAIIHNDNNELCSQCSNVSYESRHKHRLLSHTAVTDTILSVKCAFILAFKHLNKMDVIQGVTGGTDQTSGECSLC